MTIGNAIILGIIQGITEFLPISSSGHLVLAESYLNLDVQSLKAFDVVVHVGTLVAIFAYFWRDFWNFILAVWYLVFPQKLKKEQTEKAVAEVKTHQKWLGYIVLGSVPAAFVGLMWEDQIDHYFRNPMTVAFFMMATGLFFLIAEALLKTYKKRNGHRGYRKITLKRGIIIGLAQACALIPGVSRSGSTIAAAISQGIEREKAARFSFLLGSPAIFGAGLITALKLFTAENVQLPIAVMVAGFISSVVIGYLSIVLLMKFLKRHSLAVFAWYLIIIGLIMTVWMLHQAMLSALIPDFLL